MAQPVVAVLEDSPGRIRRMQACAIADLRVFTTAPSFLAWWTQREEEVHLISLDFHLGPPQAGKGLQVAMSLGPTTPVCPVILHTSDRHGALAMAAPLADGGWTVAQAVFEGSDWGALVLQLLSP